MGVCVSCTLLHISVQETHVVYGYICAPVTCVCITYSVWICVSHEVQVCGSYYSFSLPSGPGFGVAREPGKAERRLGAEGFSLWYWIKGRFDNQGKICINAKYA